MRGLALRVLPSAVPRLPRHRIAVVSPHLLRQPLAGCALRSAVRPRALRHLHIGRVLRASDSDNEAPGSTSVAGDGSDVRSDEDAVLINALDAMLAEEDLDDRERSALEQALAEARAGRVEQALQIIDAADAVEHESMSSLASKLPEELGPEEAADYVREVERQTSRITGPQKPVTADEARTLFDSLEKQLDEPVDYEAVRERNMRRLSREQQLIDSDIDAMASWIDEHEEEIDRFADDEEQLISTMRDPDGSEGLGLELGEEDLLFPGHRDASSKSVAPPVDRLDPTVPHSEEFDYTFQEMMQASADDREERFSALRQRQVDMEMMNKARGQRVGEARVREVDDKGRSFATGHKKSAIARVCLTPGEGLMFVNGRPIDLYFPYYRRYELLQPFELTGTTLSFNMTAKVHGGGLSGQLDALKYGIARALQKQDPAAYRDVLKAAKLLTRDARKVERKKSGQLKARKKFTWVKR